MEIFLDRSHTGSLLLGSYKTHNIIENKKKLNVGEPTNADFTRTLSGVASSLYLVNPGAPSDRERLILAASAPDSFVSNYRDVVITSEAPSWCPFNDNSLHDHIFKRLRRAGLYDGSKFICNPVKTAGEICGFRYSGGSSPQNLIFPIGANDINWLVMLRNSMRFGTVAASASDASERVPDIKESGFSKNIAKQALRRLRIWRALNWVAETSRAAGMMRYEPFSVGCALYKHEVSRMQLKERYERNVLYTGDHFCKESVLLSDIARGGKDSDFWTILEAVVKYKKKWATQIENDKIDTASLFGARPMAWEDRIKETNYKNDKGIIREIEQSVEAAIQDYEEIGEGRRLHLLHFVQSCLTNEQTEAIYKGVGGTTIHPAYLTNLADAVLANTSKSAVWVLMQNLLKQINFTILHTIGYEAQRILIFKIYMPALIALFLSHSGIGDVFLNGVFNLEVMKQRVANTSIRDMLARDTVADNSSSFREECLTKNAPSRHYSQYDIATLYGQLSDCNSIPLAINIGVPLHKSVMNMGTVSNVVKYTINTGLAKIRIAEENRKARRLLHRRKVQEKLANERAAAGHVVEEEEEEEEVEEEEEKEVEEEEEEEEEENDRQDKNEEDEEVEKQENGDTVQPPPTKKKKTTNYITPIPLMGGRLRENIGGFSLATIQNEDRQVNVESIQKLLTARHSNLRKKDNNNSFNDNCTYSDNEMADVSLKYIMNLMDNVFKMRNGSILNSIHTNRRTENGVYAPKTICQCGDEQQHTPDCIEKIRENDAACSESKKLNCLVDSSDPEAIRYRFRELIMDPPSLAGVEDALVVERVLQNEQMLTSLIKNPIFKAILEAPKGDLGRYVVILNIIKFINVALICLIDGDLPMLAETRIKKALKKQKVKNSRKIFNPDLSAAEAAVSGAQAEGHQYMDAGHCPEPGIKQRLLPDCIKKLKSIAMEKGRGGRSAQKRQNCDHTFCRLLKTLFFSIDPNVAAETFIDSASIATLFKLDNVCRDRKTYKTVSWFRDLISPVKLGTKSWVTTGEYTPVSPTENIAAPVDFYALMKRTLIDEGVITPPEKKRGEQNSSTIRTADQLLDEIRDASCEGYRSWLFDATTVLPVEQARQEAEQTEEAEVAATDSLTTIDEQNHNDIQEQIVNTNDQDGSSVLRTEQQPPSPIDTNTGDDHVRERHLDQLTFFFKNYEANEQQPSSSTIDQDEQQNTRNVELQRNADSAELSLYTLLQGL
uniref:Wsv037-like protein n=1 Tax=Pasiphaea japonica whispovirus TaxID=2984286 RepID=A0A9C7CGB5_9VIRU|nr:MAG: wsv037-like protein [Pasiphaea japonica whispovirus]